MDKKLLRAAFGWNHLSWGKAAEKSSTFNNYLNSDNLKILEIGASEHSIVSILFGHKNNSIKIGYYLINPENLIAKLKNEKSNFKFNAKFEIQEINAFELPNDKYDLIIYKSVLGGIFRQFSGENEINNYLNTIMINNLNDNGSIITIDNGVSIFESVFKNFGARKNNWKFFEIGTIKNYSEKVCVGCTAAFTFETRLGKVGYILDNINYYIDEIISKLISKKPTIILTVIKKFNV